VDIDEDSAKSGTSTILDWISELNLDDCSGDGPVTVRYRPDCHAWRLEDRAISVNVRTLPTARRLLQCWPR
jgi:hypothetical protein